MADDTLEIAPQSELAPAAITVSDDLRKKIVSTFRTAYDQALSDRQGIDEGIIVAERNWEMTTVERSWPWKGASNVFIPIIPEQVVAVVSATKANVFTPGGFFLVVGNDDPSAMRAHDIQRYYNAQLSLHRGLGYRTWLQEAEDFVQLSALHGTSYMDVTYLKKTVTTKFATFEPETDEEGNEHVDLETGEKNYTTKIHTVTRTPYDGVLWEALELRDIVLIPARAKSLGQAYARCRVMYMTEDEMRQYARESEDGSKPLFDRDAVDQVVKGSVSRGGSEITQDPRGTETYEIGGQVEATSQPFPDDISGRLLVTEYEIIRIETDAIDVNKDGVGEHMIYFIHRNSEVYLGGIPFPYWHDESLTVDLALMRRPKRAYGFGVPERLRTIQTEYNANFNMGNDASNIRLMPPRRQAEGVKVLGTDNGEWGPGVTFIGPKDAVGILEMQDILPSNAEIRSELRASAERISNQAPPQAQGPRVTKAGVQAAQAKQSAYQNTIDENVRYALADIFYLTHELNKQFGPQRMRATSIQGGKPQHVELTKQDLMLDIQLLINGMGGPQDPTADRNDRMLIHNMLMQRPDFANDPVRLYKLDKFGFEGFQLADLEGVLGTPEEAQQRAQAQQQAQAQQKAEEQARLASGQQKPGDKPPQAGGLHPTPLGGR